MDAAKEYNYNYSVTCDENAEYKEGECVCRENYTGDGIVCRRLAGEFPTAIDQSVNIAQV